jgi:CBS domain-containing protein
MNSLVRDMMTTEVVTVEPSTPFKEIVARLAGRRVSAARRMHAAGIKRLPVVDEDGRLLEGVVRVEDRLTYDVDDRGRDVLMTPWLRP